MLNNLVAWAYATGRVHIKSDGTPWRPIVHIEDISRAFLAAMEAPMDFVHNEAFNVGRTEDNYQIRELADIVKETVPNTSDRICNDAGTAIKRCYRVDCSKIRRCCLRFSPQWDARKGAVELLRSLPQDKSDRARRLRGRAIQTYCPHSEVDWRASELDSTLRWVEQPVSAVSGAGTSHGRYYFPLPRMCIAMKRMPILSFGRTPLADGLLTLEELGAPEITAPLDLVFCPDCSLVQITETVPPEILFCRSYPYFSSVSKSLREHFAKQCERDHREARPERDSLVIEAASNDGYMLRNFVANGIPVLGIDPAEGPVTHGQRARRQQYARFLHRGAGEGAEAARARKRTYSSPTTCSPTWPT